MHRLLKSFGILTTFGTYLILVMGAVVTKTGSGEGCGDTWPLCHGELIPSSVDLELIIEYSHRIVSALVGLFVVIFAIWTVKALPKRPEVKWFALSSIFFILFQGALGAMAVVFGQSDAVLALHFGFSLLCFTFVLLLLVEVYRDKPAAQSRSRVAVTDVSNKFRYLVWSAVVYVYAVVYTGAYVRHADATMACPDWPLCHGKWIPSLTGVEGIQFGHRIAAALSFILIAYIAYLAVRHYRERKDIYWGSLAAFILVILQIVSGGLTILTGINLFTSIIHSTIIAFLFGVNCYLALQVRKATDQRQGGKVATSAQPKDATI